MAEINKRSIRKKVKPAERLMLFKKYNYTCQNCKFRFTPPLNYDGKTTIIVGKLWLEIDHIIPISKCGLDVYENKQILCNKCNAVKYNKIISPCQVG